MDVDGWPMWNVPWKPQDIKRRLYRYLAYLINLIILAAIGWLVYFWVMSLVKFAAA